MVRQASWEYAVKLISNDKRYQLFKHHEKRKQMFNAYKIQRAREEKEEQRIKCEISPHFVDSICYLRLLYSETSQGESGEDVNHHR